jgi:hypothetical protein
VTISQAASDSGPTAKLIAYYEQIGPVVPANPYREQLGQGAPGNTCTVGDRRSRVGPGRAAGHAIP